MYSSPSCAVSRIKQHENGARAWGGGRRCKGTSSSALGDVPEAAQSAAGHRALYCTHLCIASAEHVLS